jgi:hypothetical protein
LTLLQYLYDRSGIPGGRIGLDPKGIMRALRITVERFAEDSASLAAHGFAGRRCLRGADGAASSTCSAIWVTSKGEDYLEQSQTGPTTRPRV